MECRVRGPEGDWRWFHTRTVVFVRNEQGKPTQTLGIALDVTSRREAEQKLRDSEDRFRPVFEQAPKALPSADSTTGYFESMSLFLECSGIPSVSCWERAG